jgi:putative colanic acid biosynthesis UDP-glucose lipid carrier transferase
LNRLLVLVRLADLLLIGAVLYIATLIMGEPWTMTHTAAVLLSMGIFSTVSEANRVYGPWRGAKISRELLQIWAAFLLTLPGLFIAGYFAQAHQEISNPVTAIWLLTTPVVLMGARSALRLVVQEVRVRGGNTRRAAIAGATEAALKVRRTIAESPWMGLDCYGFYDDRLGDSGDTITIDQLPDSPSTEGRCLADTHELGRFRGDFDRLLLDARAGRVDIVYVALPLRAEARIRGLIESLADTTATVHVVADVLLSDLMQSRISSVGEVPVIDVFDHPFLGVNGTLKRIEDIVLGLMILGIIALPMAIIAAAIKLTSKGPVLFRQRRYGLNGEQITVLKFRTMTVSEDGPQVTQATKNDSRITPLGAFLRRTSLDELPQFFNVLGGHMSIVGPRPHAVAHNEQYRRLISGYMLRHKVKPGITGWAQVNGWRGETDTLEKMQKRIQHDLVYIRNWALFLDIQIIFLTVFGRAVRRNAY